MNVLASNREAVKVKPVESVVTVMAVFVVETVTPSKEPLRFGGLVEIEYFPTA
jgi:hypothetical protein